MSAIFSRRVATSGVLGATAASIRGHLGAGDHLMDDRRTVTPE